MQRYDRMEKLCLLADGAAVIADMNVTETETGPLNGPSRFKDSEPRHLILAKHNQSDFKRNLFYFCPYGQ